MAGLIVPPGGFAGFAQQTPATQELFRRAGRIGGQHSAATRRRRRKAKTTARPIRHRTRRKALRAKKSRLVKGSAAAKRYMARIRRMRKK